MSIKNLSIDKDYFLVFKGIIEFGINLIYSFIIYTDITNTLKNLISLTAFNRFIALLLKKRIVKFFKVSPKKDDCL